MNSFYVLSALLLLLSTPSLAQTDHYWQINLQGRIGPKITPHKNGDGKVDQQYLFDLGIDRNINPFWGLGITMSYVNLRDDNGLIRYTEHNISTMAFNHFYVDNKWSTTAYALKITPYIKTPLTPNTILYLRPIAGIALLKTDQQIIYEINYQSVNNKIMDTYDYKAEWMTTVGLSGEYALRINSQCEGFASLSYEHFSSVNNSTRYTYDNTEVPLSSFPKKWQSDVTNTRVKQNNWDNDPHNFGDFQFFQFGLGIRIRIVR